jgi:hypothetical protein
MRAMLADFIIQRHDRHREPAQRRLAFRNAVLGIEMQRGQPGVRRGDASGERGFAPGQSGEGKEDDRDQ